MYCKKCGNRNDDDAIYCKKCGTLLEAEDETRVVQRKTISEVSSPDTVFFKIGPTLKFVKAGYVLAAVGAIVLVILLSLTPIPISLSVVFGLLLFLIPGYFHLRQMMTSYTLTGECVEVDTGLVSRTTRNIPIGRIQDVTVSSGIAQRILNFGDVVIDNASEEGGKVVIRNIDSPRVYADKLLSHIRRLER